MPRGTGLYENDEEPDGDEDRGEPMQADAEVDTDKPTPDVIEADSEDEPPG